MFSMSQVSFSNASPKWALPYLFSGQSQKEVFVNEALALLDCIVACKVESVRASVPTGAQNGQVWLVAESATGEWTGFSGKLAVWRGNTWGFVEPVNGMQIFVQSEQRYIHYNDGWVCPRLTIEFSSSVSADTSAREAIMALVSCLKQAGVIAS
jgi:hypothetical protein